MIKIFHGYEIQLNDYERNGNTYIQCLGEFKERPLTPEEEVRQALISYINDISNICLSDFSIRVEYKNLDIAFYFITNVPNFCPSVYPVLIVETKRDYTNLGDWDYQLLNYLERNFCDNGLLLNSHNILYYCKINSGFKQSLAEITDLNQIFSNCINPFSENEIKSFNSACEGSIQSFNSFKYLAEKYGRISRFTFLCKGFPAPIMDAFFIKFVGDFICFDVSGVFAGTKQNKIKKDSFIKLLSIRE